MRCRSIAAALSLAAMMAGGSAAELEARQHQERTARELIQDLGAVDPAVRARAACGLRDLGDRAEDAMSQLIALLSDGSPVDGRVCARRWSHGGPNDVTTPGELAAAAVASIGSPAFQPVLSALKSDSWIARRNAAWILGAMDDYRAVTPLVAATRDREPQVREQAAWALGAIDDRDASPALITVLKDPDQRVRRQAAWALGAIDDPRAVDPLVTALGDESADVREQAAWALGALGDSRALNSLVSALKDTSAGVRRQAAWAIGAIGK
jgi:HEAT repeat protein